MVQADNGTKFLNTTFQRMLTDNIHWYYTENKEIKAGIVEHFNHTLKTKMPHYFTFKNGPRYIDVLQKLVGSCNTTYCHSIGMLPNEVNENNEDLVRKQL